MLTRLAELTDAFNRRRSGVGRLDLKSDGNQQILQHLGRVNVVIHDQNSIGLNLQTRNMPSHRWLADTKSGGEPEAGTLARGAFNTDRAAHQFRQILADGQAQAGSAILAGGGTVSLLETLKQARPLILRETDAGVLHFKSKHHEIIT